MKTIVFLVGFYALVLFLFLTFITPNYAPLPEAHLFTGTGILALAISLSTLMLVCGPPQQKNAYTTYKRRTETGLAFGFYFAAIGYFLQPPWGGMSIFLLTVSILLIVYHIKAYQYISTLSKINLSRLGR